MKNKVSFLIFKYYKVAIKYPFITLITCNNVYNIHIVNLQSLLLWEEPSIYVRFFSVHLKKPKIYILTSKIKKIPTYQPALKNLGRVTANKIIFRDGPMCVSDLVKNLKDIFSHDVAHIHVLNCILLTACILHTGFYPNDSYIKRF